MQTLVIAASASLQGAGALRTPPPTVSSAQVRTSPARTTQEAIQRALQENPQLAAELGERVTNKVRLEPYPGDSCSTCLKSR